MSGIKRARLVLFWHGLPIFLAIVLLAFLIVTSDLTFSQLQITLTALTWGHIAVFFAISFFALVLSSIKWRLVMSKLPASPTPVPSLSASFFYTCLGAGLSLILMPHAAKPTGRALGARLHGTQPVGKSVVASIFEQTFDLAIIMFIAGFGLAYLVPGAVPLVALAYAVGAAAIVVLVRRPQLVPSRYHIDELWQLLRGPVAPRLATISLALYLLTALRAGIIAVPAGLILLPADFFASFGLVQLSRIVAVTPMGLGIADWSWAGILSFFDISLGVAAGFVLINRSLNALSILAALVVSVVLINFERRASS